MMFLGKYTIGNTQYNYIYYGHDGWMLYHKDTFSPDTKDSEILIFKIGGKTYEERKNNIQNLAIDYSNNFAGLSWSYGEIAEIGDFFYRNGKKYGLLKEFRENGVC